MAGRFQCSECTRRSQSPYGCRHCGTAAALQVQLCRTHGARTHGGCLVCRNLARSQSGR